MPLTLNVGLSRKTSQNYNSEGASINLTAELDQALLARPDELQDQVSSLYREAETALQRQQNPGGPATQSSRPKGNGDGMTQSQRRAIDAIAKRLDVDPTDEARHEFGLDLDRMTIREASRLIDHLKSLQPAGNGDRRHRAETRHRNRNPQGNRR